MPMFVDMGCNRWRWKVVERIAWRVQRRWVFRRIGRVEQGGDQVDVVGEYEVCFSFGGSWPWRGMKQLIERMTTTVHAGLRFATATAAIGTKSIQQDN